MEKEKTRARILEIAEKKITLLSEKPPSDILKEAKDLNYIFEDEQDLAYCMIRGYELIELIILSHAVRNGNFISGQWMGSKFKIDFEKEVVKMTWFFEKETNKKIIISACLTNMNSKISAKQKNDNKIFELVFPPQECGEFIGKLLLSSSFASIGFSLF